MRGEGGVRMMSARIFVKCQLRDDKISIVSINEQFSDKPKLGQCETFVKRGHKFRVFSFSSAIRLFCTVHDFLYRLMPQDATRCTFSLPTQSYSIWSRTWENIWGRSSEVSLKEYPVDLVTWSHWSLCTPTPPTSFKIFQSIARILL